MTNGTALLPETDRTAVVGTVLNNNPELSPDMAGRIVDEAVKYLAAVAESREPLVPSRVVDEGCHTLILHTRVYRKLCNKLGTFVHHTPEPRDPSRHNLAAITRTQRAIVAAGYTVDDALWLAPEDTSIPVAASCTHSPGGPEGSCTGDPDGDGPSGPN
ncbi:glycine-rich domain-containing protein [Streptomyces sp. NPDC021098]|uniref:glycine-rich domain-containing protein n=1 Tax=unclassified Streptomyces TaxID=2593676 RepID=UPI0037A9AD92